MVITEQPAEGVLTLAGVARTPRAPRHDSAVNRHHERFCGRVLRGCARGRVLPLEAANESDESDEANTLNLTRVGGGIQSGYGPGFAQVDTGSINVASDGFVTIQPDPNPQVTQPVVNDVLQDVGGSGGGGTITIKAPIRGLGEFVLGGDAHRCWN